MLQRLLLQFIKSNGRKPNNLEMILLRQKASKEAVNERKIVNMFDRQPVDANKPILGGKNIIETDEQMIQRFKNQNKEAVERLKNKKEPEDMAGGGVAGLLGERPGYKLGDIVKENIPPEYRLYLKSILPGGEEGKVDESYFTKKFKKELRSQALSKFLKTGKTKGIVTEGDQHRGDPTVNKLLKFPSTYASLGTYTYDIDPKTMDVKITDKYDWNPAYGSKSIRDKRFTGYIGDKKGTDVDLNMFKDFAVDSLRNKNIDKESLLEMTGNYFGGKQSEGKGFDVDIDIPMEEATTATEGSFAQGGPARQNFAMGKRAFLKMLGGVGAGIAGLKSGLLGFGKKEAAKKAVTETVKQTAGSGAPPPYFFKLVEKIKTLGDDVTQKAATQDRQVVKQYKDFELTEDVTTGEIQIFKRSQSDEAIDRFGGENATEEVFMRYKPSEDIIGKNNKPVKTGPEYEENTSYISNNRENTGGILDEVDGVTDDVLKEVEAGSGNVPESFYTGPNAIKKADGGRIGYAVGNKVIGKGIMAGINKLFGKPVITTADKIKRPQQALDREMFKKFETNYPETGAADATLNIPVQQEGKFTKAEYLIQRLENTIKQNPKDKYVKETFPNFIKELKDNPELAKNENVFKELGGDLPKGQQIVVYGDDSIDFFTQKSGPGNIDRLKKIMSKYNISKDKALKIMKMEPNDQVMEFKMLEIANRKLNATGGLANMLGE